MQTNSTKLSVILLDRDGVINREPGPILYPEDFVMIPRSADAIASVPGGSRNGRLALPLLGRPGHIRGEGKRPSRQSDSGKRGFPSSRLFK